MVLVSSVNSHSVQDNRHLPYQEDRQDALFHFLLSLRSSDVKVTTCPISVLKQPFTFFDD